MYKKIEVELTGTSPLLMNRLSLESLQKKSRKVMKVYDVEEDARDSAYMTADEELYVPMEALFSMMIYAAGAHKIGRRSMKSYLAGGIRIEPEKILLTPNEYEVDLRAVVIQRARVIRSRAKVKDWKIEFTLIYDDEILTAEPLRAILDDAGKRVGLLDFRPQRSGWFGTFTVTNFNPL